MGRVEGKIAIVTGASLGHRASVRRRRNCSPSTVQTYGGLDVLHNNAAAVGIAAHQDGPVSAVDPAIWDDTMRINVRGTALAIKFAAVHMIRRGGGSIINTSSGAGLLGDLAPAAYGASKAAINSLTQYAATEYGKQGVRVNAIAPGLILTDATRASGHAEHLLPIMIDNMLTTRAGEPLDIAYMVLYLASDESGYVTGQVISVDGGLGAHQPYVAEMRALFAAQA